METFEELLGFISHSNTQVRKIAIQNVMFYSKTEQYVAYIKANKGRVIRPICRLIGDQQVIASDAITTLINFSGDPELCQEMLECGVVDRTMEVLFFPQDDTDENAKKVLELCFILLANVTQQSEGIERLLKAKKGDKYEFNELYIRKLLYYFFSPRYSNMLNADLDHSKWIGNVLTNISRVEAGRSFIVDGEKKNLEVFKQFVPLLEAENAVRRGGAAGTIRNCLFLDAKHEAILKETTLLQTLLKRLVKGVETNTGIKKMLAQCLHIITCSPSGGIQYVQEHHTDLADNIQMIIEDHAATPGGVVPEKDLEVLEILQKIINTLRSDADGSDFKPGFVHLQTEPDDGDNNRGAGLLAPPSSTPVPDRPLVQPPPREQPQFSEEDAAEPNLGDLLS